MFLLSMHKMRVLLGWIPFAVRSDPPAMSLRHVTHAGHLRPDLHCKAANDRVEVDWNTVFFLQTALMKTVSKSGNDFAIRNVSS